MEMVNLFIQAEGKEQNRRRNIRAGKGNGDNLYEAHHLYFISYQNEF